MSTISKIAVYDARLQQDEPAYAVQKGALSVSVAPFQAISANASQMTFQVLVPSLNVFVDRKIQLSSTLYFSSNLYYAGPRNISLKQCTASGVTGAIATASGLSTLTIGTAPSTAVVVGAKVSFSGSTPGLYVQTVTDATHFVLSAPQATIASAANTVTIENPLNWDVVDPAMGVQAQLTTDIGFMNANQSQTFQQLGYCTAVSAKDLAYCAFPVQSALTNMTATLNDCTVTTNGDTLREQLLLTQTPENTKQRTTPSNMDSFAWGRDDVFNGSGNFSSYSTVNGYGDIPNGAYPTTWFADDKQTSALSKVKSAVIAKTSTSYPFLDTGVTGNFMPGAAAGVSGGNISTQSGVGWYVAKQSTGQVTQLAAAYGTDTSGTVIVPFVNNQPVWTTGFPGGDLICKSNSVATTFFSPGFTLDVNDSATYAVLTLLQTVPPYCMIAARLYTTNGTVAGRAPSVLGWVSSLKSGSLGQVGSKYTIIAGTAFTSVTAVTLSLSAGWQAPLGPLPVYGALQTVEPLVLSPLIWADSAEFQTVGLYGMTNMQFVLNFASLGTCFAAQNGLISVTEPTTATLPMWVDDMTRLNTNTGNILRSSNVRTVLSDLAFSASSQAGTGPWGNPTLYVGFLTPGPDITLPLVSTVPYVEFPRYVKTDSVQTFGSSQVFSTNTISLTSIPDMIMVYVKPGTKGPSSLDTYIPISNCTVTFDNFSNLCSGFQQFNLYESAVAAGLPMDWHHWRGYTQAAYPSLARSSGSPNSQAITQQAQYTQTGFTQLSGGPILLRMGHDVTLSPGLAPGCLGNYSIQINLTASNPYGYFDSVTSTTTTLIAINTGFFETVRGQSAIRKTILNSADVEAATPEGGMTKTHLNRMVGRGNWLSAASTGIGKAVSLANKANDLNKKYDISGKAAAMGVPGAALAGRALSYAPQAQQLASQFGMGGGKRPRSGLV